MKEYKIRWSPWEVATALLLALASCAAWWSLPIFGEDGQRSPWIFIGGVVVAVLMYLGLSIIDGTHRLLRRLALLVAFGSSIPFAFVKEPLIGVGTVLVAAFLAEVGAMRIEGVRHAFQRPRSGFMARRGLPFYFSAVSIVLTAVLFTSPLGAHVLRNPLSDKTIRGILTWSDPFLKPLLGFSLTGNVDHVLAQITETNDPALIAEARKGLSDRLGISFREDDDLAAIVAQYITGKIDGIQKRLGAVYSFSFLFSAFLLFRFLSIPFTWMTMLLIAPLLLLVKSGGGIHAVEEPTVRVTFQWKHK